MEKGQALASGEPNVGKKKCSPPFLAVKKLTGQNVIRVAAKHNLREIQAEVGAGKHIDPARMHLNQVVVGPCSAADVVADGERLMEEAGLGKLRRDAVRAIEIVISLPLVNTIDQSVFFSDALNWVQDYYNVPILSAVIHLDESAPHCHMLLLTLIGGRMTGSALVGNTPRLRAMRTSFYQRVGQKHGLARPTVPPRLNSSMREKCASMLHTAVVDDPSLLLQRKFQAALLEVFGLHADLLFAALELPVPETPKSHKPFVEIMTKPCPLEKPAKPLGFNRHSKPMENGSPLAEKHQSLSCVGFDDDQTSFRVSHSSCPRDTSEFQNTVDFSREYEDEIPSKYWNPELREFPKQKAKAPSVRDSATAELNRALARLRKGGNLESDPG